MGSGPWNRSDQTWAKLPSSGRLDIDSSASTLCASQQVSGNSENSDDGGVKLDFFPDSDNFPPLSTQRERPALQPRTSNTHLSSGFASSGGSARLSTSGSGTTQFSATARPFCPGFSSTHDFGISDKSTPETVVFPAIRTRKLSTSPPTATHLRQGLSVGRQSPEEQDIDGWPVTAQESSGSFTPFGNTRLSGRSFEHSLPFDVYRDVPAPANSQSTTPVSAGTRSSGHTPQDKPVSTLSASLSAALRHHIDLVPTELVSQLAISARRNELRPPPGLDPPRPETPTLEKRRLRVGFKPMNNLHHDNENMVDPQAHARDVALADSTAFSANYRGERSIKNASVDHLAPERNCALWLTNLPADTTYHHLLSAISSFGPFGRIYCTVINKPDYVVHDTAAAKVVFFQPDAAQRLRQKALREGLVIGGRRIRVAHNRVKHAETPVGAGTRVLIVTGDADRLSAASLDEYFSRYFEFDVDAYTTLVKDDRCNRAVVEVKFGSWRCQAQMGKMALEKNQPEWLMKVEFGQDPCEVGHDMTSYGIAGMRIQGIGI